MQNNEGTSNNNNEINDLEKVGIIRLTVIVGIFLLIAGVLVVVCRFFYSKKGQVFTDKVIDRLTDNDKDVHKSANNTHVTNNINFIWIRNVLLQSQLRQIVMMKVLIDHLMC